MKQIMTAGYGNLVPEEFVAMLKEAGVTIVRDIRRKGSKSWNGRYNQGGACGMNMLMHENDIEYQAWPKLGNNYDTLEAYGHWLERARRWEIEQLAAGIESALGPDRLCLICSEGKPFEADGVTPRCHRVYVAEALVAELGEGWSVKYLQKGES